MNPKTKNNHWLIKLLNKTPLRIVAMTFNGVIYLLTDERHMGKITMNHEKIHAVQQKEMSTLKFLYLYFIDGLFKNWMSGYTWANAYYMISFEKEAYKNEKNLKYLLTRESNAWKKYKI